MQLRLALISVLLLVSSLVVGACGGNQAKESYLEGLSKIQLQLDEASTAAVSVGADASRQDRALALESAHSRIEKAAVIADALKPPKNVRSVHRELVAALQDYADVFKRIAEASPDDPSETTKLYGEAGEIQARLQKANESLKEAGYTVEKRSTNSES